MGTPLGDFIRTMRDSTEPGALGLPDHGRRRSPGLRRLDLAARAGISVEYLTRIEQGRDSHPSVSVINALADALSLDSNGRNHLRYLAKISGGECAAHAQPAPPLREVRPEVIQTLRLLEPGIAVVTNRLGDILAHTSGYEALVRGSGLLDGDAPNLTRYIFTDPRARTFFLDWDDVADEQAFDLWLGPSIENAEWLAAELAQTAGPEFTRRRDRQVIPPRGPLRLCHVSGKQLRLHREVLDVSTDKQQLIVYLAADEPTSTVLDEWRAEPGPRLRSIS